MQSVQRRKEIGKSIELSMTVDGALNPQWVEWLMGWPRGWTDLTGKLETFKGWEIDPADVGEIDRVNVGVKNRADRLKALGNGQVPSCVALAWEVLNQCPA